MTRHTVDARTRRVQMGGHPQRRRDGAIPVHLRPAGATKWRRGHVVWVDDVLAFRPGLPARGETRFRVAGSYERPPTADERWWIHRHGGDLVLGTLLLHGGGSVDVATRRRHGPTVFGTVRLEKAA